MNVIGAAKAIITRDQFIHVNVVPGRHSSGKGICHAKWMLEEISKGGMSDGKANRWLGYAQGALVSMDVATLEEMKEINKEFSD